MTFDLTLSVIRTSLPELSFITILGMINNFMEIQMYWELFIYSLNAPPPQVSTTVRYILQMNTLINKKLNKSPESHSFGK